MPSLLAGQFELPALGEDGFLVQSGWPARYLLSAGTHLHKSISAARALAELGVRASLCAPQLQGSAR